MKVRSGILIVFALAVVLAAPDITITSSLLRAAPLKAQKQNKGEKQKKKKGKKQDAAAGGETSAPTAPAPKEVAPAAETQPAAPAPAQPKPASAKPVSASQPVKTAKAEDDPLRAAWAVDVAPYLVLGSGHPGKAASDFDKPDGVAFTPTGLLLATDAKNRRVHVWDVKTGSRVGEFGHRTFGGEIVDIAVSPGGTVLVTDQLLNLAYAFEPPKPGAVDEKGKPVPPYEYQFQGTRFGEQGFDKLGGIAIDSRGRIYLVDAHLNEVRRFKPDYTPDPSWKFERARANGTTYLHGCEGIAIDETTGNLYIASEKDSVVQVFDMETGAYKRRLIGAGEDATGAPAGTRVFFGSVEGLTLVKNHLLAVDESAGHIQVFNLSAPDTFNKDLKQYVSTVKGRSGYKGYFGHSPLVDFEDKADLALQQKVKDGAIIPGQANPPGYFCSPDAIASYDDKASGESYIAVADQCNYRLVVYRWSDIGRKLDHKVVAGVSKAVAGSDTTAVSGAKKGKKKKP